jgi:H+-transporting ATPase
VYYRVAMTIDIMLLVVASVVLLQFRPLTAIMIVVLALLDDIPIMTIAYDNVPASPRPVRWDMHRILIFATLMGLFSLAESLTLLLAGLEWIGDPERLAILPLDSDSLQTMMFLQLAVGGHLLLLVVRTRHSVLWPPYPSAPLFLAVVATQIVAALICGFGILVPRLPWIVVAAVWVYSLAWMFVIDFAKLVYHRSVEAREDRLRALAAPIAGR